MKRRPPGFKSRQLPKTASTPSDMASMLVGADALAALDSLMDRMSQKPGNFIFFDDDGILDYLHQHGMDGISNETLQIQDETAKIQE